jgi:hypothetical protein
MKRNYWRGFIALLWFALPGMALRYWRVWDRLPVQMASHFDAAGNPQGWMSRQQSLVFTLAFLAFMVTVSSVILLAIHRRDPISTLSWGLVAFHSEIWSIVWLHSGRLWGAIFAIPLVATGSVVAVVPNPTLRFAAGLRGLLFMGVFAMAGDGFHYCFTRHGLEIRTLGFRLKSIPGSQIRQYGVESWNPRSGYGIRGLGNHKAYVWGNRGVRVHLDDGEVFLGHSSPQCIVHDLDLIKQFAH